MNAKLRGGSKSELTRLKELWRDTLDESQRDYWRALFLSKTTQARIRQEVGERLGINLTFDKQLNQFRDWELEQRTRDLEAERMVDDERRVSEEHGEWTLDQIREEVLKRSYARSLADGNFKQGLATVREDTKVKAQQFEETKFKESLRNKLQAGLDAVADAFQGNAEAMKLYQQARTMITRETQ